MEDAQKELRGLVTEALREFISPVQVLQMQAANGTVSGVFRSGARLFDFRVSGSGVSYKPRPVAGAPRGDSAVDIRSQERDRFLAQLRSRRNA